jgi:pyrroline-5-carboxylate reductase
MNAFTALSGSGPGYVFHFLESLAEAGVSVGLGREDSRAIALGLLRGCAAMAEQSGLHPAVLREQVSSPAGTTIAGLNHLDRQGARGILVDAVREAARRSEEMEREARRADS